MLPFPGDEVLQQVRNKSQLEATAAAAGLATPGGLFEGTAAELAGHRFKWPVVVKPAQPVSALKTARLVGDEEELRRLLERRSPRRAAAGPGAREGPARVHRAGDRQGGAPGRPVPAGDAPHVAFGGRLHRPRDERRAGRGPRVPYRGDAGRARVLGTGTGRLRRDAVRLHAARRESTVLPLPAARDRLRDQSPRAVARRRGRAAGRRARRLSDRHDLPLARGRLRGRGPRCAGAAVRARSAAPAREPRGPPATRCPGCC